MDSISSSGFDAGAEPAVISAAATTGNEHGSTAAVVVASVQAIRFGSLDFVADTFGRLRLLDEEALLASTPQGLGGLSIINRLREDPGVLAQMIDAYLGPHAGIKDQRRVFYALPTCCHNYRGKHDASRGRVLRS